MARAISGETPAGSPADVRLETRRKFDRLIPARSTPEGANWRQISGSIGLILGLNSTALTRPLLLSYAVFSASATRAPNRFVPVLPPRSGVREAGSDRTVSIALSIAWNACS